VTTTAPEGEQIVAPAKSWRLGAHEFFSNKLGVAGLVVLVLIVLFCFLGPLFHHTEQVHADPLLSDLPPGPGHPLGTDGSGFDELGRIMLGGQAALEIGLLTALVATVFGTIFGAISGLLGGLADAAMMRIVDILLSIPFLFVVLILATKYQGTVLSLSLVIASFAWLYPARLVRAEVLSLRTRDFVSAARTMGTGPVRIIFRHLIPNSISVAIVNVTFQVADAILAISFLGFLGFGLSFPDVSWGDMLGGAQNAISNGYWWQVYPVGACLVLVVLAANFVGDALRDAFDIRLRRR